MGPCEKKHYAVTEVDGEAVLKVVDGFEWIAGAIGSGHKVRFRAFASAQAAEAYLRTGNVAPCGHSHAGSGFSHVGSTGIGRLTRTAGRKKKKS